MEKNSSIYTLPKKITDYLYYMEYKDYSFESSVKLASDIEFLGGCSSIRNGNFFGRNFDLSYCDSPEFVVRMTRNDKRFSSIGICVNPDFTSDLSKISDEEFLMLPSTTSDGINENGVVVSVHVVLPGKLDDKCGTNAGKKQIYAQNVVRYLLDNSKSANHAAKLLQEVDIIGGYQAFSLHWIIADKEDTIIAEIINGEMTFSRNTYKFMTNFYMNYGPIIPSQIVAGRSFNDLPRLNEHAIGVERWSFIRDNYLKCDTIDGMKCVLESIKATTVYNLPCENTWFSEYTMRKLPINSSLEQYISEAYKQRGLYEKRNRLNPAGDWITWHSSIYDIKAREFVVYVQENYDRKYAFAL